jgi:hypothetical protein
LFASARISGGSKRYARQNLLVAEDFIERLCSAGNQCASLVSLTPGWCGRIEVHAHRSFVIGMDRHALQTQFPPSRIELWNAPQFRLPSLHSVLITSAARNPMDTIATTINGHSTTTQKEIFQSEFLGVGFLFMPLFSSVRRSTFQKR